jgi:Helicase associated domain
VLKRRHRHLDRGRRALRPRFKPGWFELVLDLLNAYVSRTGHAEVPRKHRQGNFDLGRMVLYLRECRGRGELSPERMRELERLPGWSWDPLQDRFEHGLGLLRLFVAREGHAFVLPSHREAGFALGEWVARRRSQYPEGSLSRDRIRALEAVPGWTWEVLNARDREALRLVREFALREGHARVPRGYRVLGLDLGGWVVFQRRRFRAGRLPPATQRALERVPHWSWDPVGDRFEAAVAHLRRFAQRHGHSLVPQAYRDRDFALGAWVAAVRYRYKQGHLPRDRARRLAGLPGWSWDGRDRSPRRIAASRPEQRHR